MSWLYILYIPVIIYIGIIVAAVIEHFKIRRKLKDKKINSKINYLENKIANLEGVCPICGKTKGSKLVCSGCGYKYVEGENCADCGNYFPYSELTNISSWQDRKGKRCKECTRLVKLYPEARNSMGIKNTEGERKYVLRKDGSSVLSTEEHLEMWIKMGFKIEKEYSE